MRIPIDKVERDFARYQIRQENCDDTVAQYAENIEVLPPVDVHKLPDGRLVLTNGFLRLEAHILDGRDTINATVHVGTEKEAEEFAIAANTKHGRPLTAAERDEAVRRLAVLKPDAGPLYIAKKLSMSRQVVQDVLDADKVRQHIGPYAAGELDRRRLVAICRAAKKYWEPLALKVRHEDLTRDRIVALNKRLREAADDGAAKRILRLRGQTDGKRVGDVLDEIGDDLNKIGERTAWDSVRDAVSDVCALRLIEDYDAESMLRTAPNQRHLDGLLTETREAIKVLTEILDAADTRRTLRLVK